MDVHDESVAFHNFANVHKDENLCWCTCLCAICNKAYFVAKLCVSTNTSLQGFWIQWVQVKGMYTTAEVYFGYVINFSEANRLKFGGPEWIM